MAKRFTTTALRIPELVTDADVIQVIDELKYRLKSGAHQRPIGEALNQALNQIILEHGLDDDSHQFASRPSGRST